MLRRQKKVVRFDLVCLEVFMFSTEFLMTSVIVVLIPGTGAIYTISTGIFQGWRASIFAALGCTVGIIPHLLASILGLSFVLHMSAVVFQGLKFAGVIYMIYLAYMMWHENGALVFESTSASANPWQIALKAVLLNILNPKLTLFFLAFLPLFIAKNTFSPIIELLKLSAVFMAITLVIFVLYGILASGVRHYVIHSPKIMIGLRRSFAVTFAVLGLRLAMIDQ
jgi:threonine/homoserine/homoserine lactone efflux protein